MLSRIARLAAYVGHARARTLLIAGGLIIGLTLAAAMTWFAVTTREATIADAVREMRNDAMMLAEQEDRLMQAVDVVQVSLIDHMRELGIDTPEKFESLMATQEVHHYLQDRVAGLSFIAALSLSDRHGGLLNFSRAWPIPPVNDADRDFVQALLAAGSSQTFISEPSQSKTTGQWTIYLSRRFVSRDGQLIGFVISTIQMNDIEQLFAHLPLTGGGAYALFRRDGMLLARYPNLDSLIGATFAGTANFNRDLAALDDGIVIQHSALDGRDRLMVPHAIAHYPLLIVVSDTMESILAQWAEETRMLAATTVLLELVLAVIILLSVRHMRSHELLQTAEAARTRAEAELAVAEERERAAHVLHTQEQRFDTALNNMLQGLLMLGHDGLLLVANRRFHKMFGLPPGAVAPGMTYSEITDRVIEFGNVDAEDMQRMRERRAELVARNEHAVTTWDLSDKRSFNVTHQPMEEGWLTTFEEITDRRRAEAMMVHLAHHDALTDLPNRVLFRTKLEEALAFARRGHNLALLCLDLDQFKTVNAMSPVSYWEAYLFPINQPAGIQAGIQIRRRFPATVGVYYRHRPGLTLPPGLA